MPRYFFNARINGELVLDPDGQDLRDPDQAWAVAKAAISDLVAEESSAGLLRSSMEVTDEGGEIVFELPFAEALG